MGITSDKLNKLLETKQAIKQAIIDKGVEVSEDDVFADYPSKIEAIEAVIEGGNPYYEGLYNQRTNNGTNMSNLFAYVPSGITLDLTNLDTSRCTNTYGLFRYFEGIADISNLDFSKSTSPSYMFTYANIDNIQGIGSIKNPQAYTYSYMFGNTTGSILDLSLWDISIVTNMERMFYSSEIKRIDLSGWVTTNVTTMSYMFYSYGSGVEELIIPDWDMTKTTSYSSIFGTSSTYNTGLRYVDISRSNSTTLTKIANSLPTKSESNYGEIVVPSDLTQENFNTLIAKYWKPLGTSLLLKPTSCEIISELDELKPNKSTRLYLGSLEPWCADINTIELIVLDESMASIKGNEVISTGVLGNIDIVARLKDTQEVLDTKTINVSETDSYPNLVKFRLASTPVSSADVITVNGIGKRISALAYEPLSDIYSYDSSELITGISFSKSLKEVIKLNTSQVTNMNSMFSICTNLTELDLSSFDTSNVTNMQNMFSGCTNLTSLDLSSFDTSQVTSMLYMFYGCTNLTSLDLSSFDTSNVTTMVYMFYNCQSLTNLKAPKNICVSVDFSYSTKLTYESLIGIINNLSVVTSTENLTLGVDNLSKLSDEEIAIATNKGWSVR